MPVRPLEKLILYAIVWRLVSRLFRGGRRTRRAHA
jgi:hypothetical protein